MIEKIISSINFIDIIMALIIVRCVYVGASAGLVIEFFKLLGMLCATFITLHYYAVFAELLSRLVPLPVTITNLVSFVTLWILVVLIFKVVRDGWMLVIKTEAQETFNKLGGALTGIFRGVLVCGITMSVIFLSGSQYLIKHANMSFSGVYLTHFSIAIYESSFDKFPMG